MNGVRSLLLGETSINAFPAWRHVVCAVCVLAVGMQLFVAGGWDGLVSGRSSGVRALDSVSCVL